MKKWFSFNSKTQRTEVVEPSKELFESSPLLFWTRGMEEWGTGAVALEFFLKPVEIAKPLEPVMVVEEKKEAIKPKESEVKDSTPIICPVVSTVSNIIKAKNIKKAAKKRKVKSHKKAKSIKKIAKTKPLKKRKKSKKK